jgi:hypothetical protein
MRAVMSMCVRTTAILIMTEGQFQIFQRFPSSNLVLKAVESRFAALNYYENGSTTCRIRKTPPYPCAYGCHTATFVRVCVRVLLCMCRFICMSKRCV